MKAEEIMQVLRLTAMGRLNTPAQEEFCEKLAKAMAEPVLPTLDDIPDGSVSPADTPLMAVAKRGPGRPKKAE